MATTNQLKRAASSDKERKVLNKKKMIVNINEKEEETKMIVDINEKGEEIKMITNDDKVENIFMQDLLDAMSDTNKRLVILSLNSN